MAEPDRDARLRAQLATAHDELVKLVARRLRLAPGPVLPPGVLERARHEVDDALTEWRIAEERAPSLQASTDLQRLLAIFTAIEREIGRGPDGAGE